MHLNFNRFKVAYSGGFFCHKTYKYAMQGVWQKKNLSKEE